MQKNIHSDITLLQSLFIMLLSYAWIAYLCALFAVFYMPLVWGMWVIALIVLMWKKFLPFPRPSHILALSVVLSILLATLVALVTVPTIYEGRDQGSISNAALQLATHHTPLLHLPEADLFFAHYGAGKALNFPGFVYTATGALTTQFPLPYIAFLSGFIGLFGLAGLNIANAILLIFFLVGFFMLARSFFITKQRFVWWFFALLATASPVLIFAKATLSENLAGALLAGAIFLFLAFRQKPAAATALAFGLAWGLLFFVRIEGLWFFAIFLFLILRTKPIRAWLMKDAWWRIAVPTVLFITIALVALVVNMPFYKTLLGVVADTAVGATGTTEDSFVLYVLIAYNLLIPLLLSGALALWVLHKKTTAKILLPFVITLPLFLYYITPHITLDAPWMLRRFSYALLPVTLFGMTAFLALASKNTTKKILVTTIFSLLIVHNLFITLPTLFFADHRTLGGSTSTLASNFTERDLVLLAPGVSGDGFAMLGAPLRNLYNIHAVYFFNPSDLTRIDTQRFAHVYLITPNDDTLRYAAVLGDAMTPVAHFAITTTFSPPQKTLPLTIGLTKTQTTSNTVYQLR